MQFLAWSDNWTWSLKYIKFVFLSWGGNINIPKKIEEILKK